MSVVVNWASVSIVLAGALIGTLALLYLLGGLVLALRLAFLTRWSILSGLALPGVLLAVVLAPNLLKNLLVLETAPQLFNITWLSLFVAMMVVATFRVTQLNPAARFSDYGSLVEAYCAELETNRRLGGLRTRLSQLFRPDPARG